MFSSPRSLLISIWRTWYAYIAKAAISVMIANPPNVGGGASAVGAVVGGCFEALLRVLSDKPDFASAIAAGNSL